MTSDDGWSEVSLSAQSSDLSSEDISDALPGSQASQDDPHKASVQFKPQSGALLDDVLADVLRYMKVHGQELRNGLGDAEFQLRVSWSRRSPQDPVPISPSLLGRLAEVKPQVVIEATDDDCETAEPTKEP
jgi:hypothetical protein